jgi:hypothetical protein
VIRGIWSFLMAVIIVYLVGKSRLVETIIITWIMAFVMMWLVIGNLNVLSLRRPPGWAGVLLNNPGCSV